MSCGKCGSNECNCLCPVSFGIALGVACAIFMAFYAWAAWLWGYGTGLIIQYSSIYFGYAPSFMGGVWGALWGLVSGFIFGFILILVYNLCMCCKAKCCRKGRDE